MATDIAALDAPKTCRDCPRSTMLTFDGIPLCHEHDNQGRGANPVPNARTGMMDACDVLRLSAAQQMAPADVEPGAVTAHGVVASVRNDPDDYVTLVFFDDSHYTVRVDHNVTVLGRVDREMLRRLRAVS